jgi:hypothetical protein
LRRRQVHTGRGSDAIPLGREAALLPFSTSQTSTSRADFTAHRQQYYELRGILAPIGDAERECNTTLLPPDLASAYDELIAG